MRPGLCPSCHLPVVEREFPRELAAGGTGVSALKGGSGCPITVAIKGVNSAESLCIRAGFMWWGFPGG